MRKRTRSERPRLGLRDGFCAVLLTLGLEEALATQASGNASSVVHLATVPMDPASLPESVLLFTGLFAGVAALVLLVTRGWHRALRAGLLALTCFGLTFAMAKTLHQPARPAALRPAKESSMSLVLGDVVLRVAPSKRYVLSVDGKEFLVLSIERSQLRVSGVMGARNQPLTTVSENTFPFSRPSSVRPARDANTILVQEEGKDLFKVRYAEPRRIEVTGQFFETKSNPTALISCDDGISWSGGTIPRGTTVDLTDQGSGSVDFGRSGVVRILPRT
jgi:hypothetical protein